MTVKQARENVAYRLWKDNKKSSLYNTATTLPPDDLPQHKHYCRLSWGLHWCDPINHGFEYHGKHWSNARGIELLEAFALLSDSGRTNPSMMLMGDSTMQETHAAGLCSLARAKVSFLPQCPQGVGVNQCSDFMTCLYSVCFTHPRIRGTAVWAFFSDQQFHIHKDEWKRAIFGCMDLKNCHLPPDNGATGKFVKWDAIMPNLGVHYNFPLHPPDNKKLQTYKHDLAELFQYLSEHSQKQLKEATKFPTLHLFWGSYPQHFAGGPGKDGIFWDEYLNGPHSHGCTAIYPSEEASRSNRRRTTVAWEVLISAMKNTAAGDIVECNNTPALLYDPSNIKTKEALLSPCLNNLLNTCQGGIMHMEVEPFMTNRPEVHPGKRCAAFPVEFDNDPNETLCDTQRHTSSDCTHHCWGPILFQPIWERLEIAVKYHLQRCSGVKTKQH